MSETETVDPRVELLRSARQEFFQADGRETEPLYVPPGVLPHFALANIRASLYRHLLPEDQSTARAIIALDRVIAELSACDVHVVYERHGN